MSEQVVCAYAGKYQETGHLKTFGTYKLLGTKNDRGTEYVNIIDESGAERTYIAKRFVKLESK